MFSGFYYDQILEKDEAMMQAKKEILDNYGRPESTPLDVDEMAEAVEKQAIQLSEEVHHEANLVAVVSESEGDHDDEHSSEVVHKDLPSISEDKKDETTPQDDE